MESRKGMGPITAGMTGLVIGVVGTAVGIALSKKENRDKLSAKAHNLADWGTKQVQDFKNTAENTASKVRQESTSAARGIKGGSRSK